MALGSYRSRRGRLQEDRAWLVGKAQVMCLLDLGCDPLDSAMASLDPVTTTVGLAVTNLGHLRSWPWSAWATTAFDMGDLTLPMAMCGQRFCSPLSHRGLQVQAGNELLPARAGAKARGDHAAWCRPAGPEQRRDRSATGRAGPAAAGAAAGQ